MDFFGHVTTVEGCSELLGHYLLSPSDTAVPFQITAWLTFSLPLHGCSHMLMIREAASKLCPPVLPNSYQ